MRRIVKRLLLAVACCIALAGCNPPRVAQKNSHAGGCAHNHELPPLHLTVENKRMLASVSPTPSTALDYYMLLPKSRFGIMPDSPERRVTYVKKQSNEFLEASHWFECNGGGFGVTLKLYRTPTRTFLLLKHDDGKDQYDDRAVENRELPTVENRPSLWLYSEGKWSQQTLPGVPRERVLKKLREGLKTDGQRATDMDFIDINYVVSPETDDIVLMGRGNCQAHAYEYARLKWQNSRFVLE